MFLKNVVSDKIEDGEKKLRKNTSGTGEGQTREKLWEKEGEKAMIFFQKRQSLGLTTGAPKISTLKSRFICIKKKKKRKKILFVE